MLVDGRRLLGTVVGRLSAPDAQADPLPRTRAIGLIWFALRPYTCTDDDGDAMATKTDRLEARLTRAQRKRIEHSAALAGEPVSSFLVAAALDRAEVLVTEQATTVVPSDYFDRLVSSLDEAGRAPALERAARTARRRRRITAA
jgi:uncharacterized protein (DUF1778 family)